MFQYITRILLFPTCFALGYCICVLHFRAPLKLWFLMLLKWYANAVLCIATFVDLILKLSAV